LAIERYLPKSPLTVKHSNLPICPFIDLSHIATKIPLNRTQPVENSDIERARQMEIVSRCLSVISPEAWSSIDLDLLGVIDGVRKLVERLSARAAGDHFGA
jgi:hypothetical protein